MGSKVASIAVDARERFAILAGRGRLRLEVVARSILLQHGDRRRRAELTPPSRRTEERVRGNFGRLRAVSMRESMPKRTRPGETRSNALF